MVPGDVVAGDGWAIAFKMESHNHPSFVEPFQGAATGVGGIMRDVFTMGARPLANLNSLRFGAATHPRTPYLLRGVVAGIELAAMGLGEHDAVPYHQGTDARAGPIGVFIVAGTSELDGSLHKEAVVDGHRSRSIHKKGLSG